MVATPFAGSFLVDQVPRISTTMSGLGAGQIDSGTSSGLGWPSRGFTPKLAAHAPMGVRHRARVRPSRVQPRARHDAAAAKVWASLTTTPSRDQIDPVLQSLLRQSFLPRTVTVRVTSYETLSISTTGSARSATRRARGTLTSAASSWRSSGLRPSTRSTISLSAGSPTMRSC